MPRRNSLPRTSVASWATVALTALLLGISFVWTGPPVSGQQGRGSARTIAPIDLTGTWVSVVTEDWRHRMATARRGDYESLPINGEGRRVADAWDLDADNAAGLQCKAFGIGGIMRQPGRLRISWQDDTTLRLEFDAGTQTRLLHFDPSSQPSGELTWQGYSAASWEGPGVGRGGRAAQAQFEIGGGEGRGPVAPGGGGQGLRGGPPPPPSWAQGGFLKVVTTHFREGYLRKNGVPYSERASIAEYFHRLPPTLEGDVWLHVLTIVDDPMYLRTPFYTSTHFKLEADDSKWNATPCFTDPPPSGERGSSEDRTSLGPQFR